MNMVKKVFRSKKHRKELSSKNLKRKSERPEKGSNKQETKKFNGNQIVKGMKVPRWSYANINNEMRITSQPKIGIFKNSIVSGPAFRNFANHLNSDEVQARADSDLRRIVSLANGNQTEKNIHSIFKSKTDVTSQNEPPEIASPEDLAAFEHRATRASASNESTESCSKPPSRKGSVESLKSKTLFATSTTPQSKDLPRAATKRSQKKPSIVNIQKRAEAIGRMSKTLATKRDVFPGKRYEMTLHESLIAISSKKQTGSKSQPSSSETSRKSGSTADAPSMLIQPKPNADPNLGTPSTKEDRQSESSEHKQSTVDEPIVVDLDPADFSHCVEGDPKRNQRVSFQFEPILDGVNPERLSDTDDSEDSTDSLCSSPNDGPRNSEEMFSSEPMDSQDSLFDNEIRFTLPAHALRNRLSPPHLSSPRTLRHASTNVENTCTSDQNRRLTPTRRRRLFQIGDPMDRNRCLQTLHLTENSSDSESLTYRISPIKRTSSRQRSQPFRLIEEPGDSPGFKMVPLRLH